MIVSKQAIRWPVYCISNISIIPLYLILVCLFYLGPCSDSFSKISLGQAAAESIILNGTRQNVPQCRVDCYNSDSFCYAFDYTENEGKCYITTKKDYHLIPKKGTVNYRRKRMCRGTELNLCPPTFYFVFI